MPPKTAGRQCFSLGKDLIRCFIQNKLKERQQSVALLQQYLDLDFHIQPQDTYLEASAKIGTSLQQLPSSQLMGGNYVNPWLRRMLLEGDDTDLRYGDLMEHVYGCTPDQKDIWHLLTGGASQETIGAVCSKWSYQGLAKRITCLGCLVADTRITALLPATGVAEYLRDNMNHLDACMRTYRAEHGMWPCPAVLLRVAKAMLRTEVPVCLSLGQQRALAIPIMTVLDLLSMAQPWLGTYLAVIDCQALSCVTRLTGRLRITTSDPTMRARRICSIMRKLFLAVNRRALVRESRLMKAFATALSIQEQSGACMAMHISGKEVDAAILSIALLQLGMRLELTAEEANLILTVPELTHSMASEVGRALVNSGAVYHAWE